MVKRSLLKLIYLFIPLLLFINSSCELRRNRVPTKVVLEKNHVTKREHRYNSAVYALLKESDEMVNQGEYERAAAKIERALRISPSDPNLWHRLAWIKLKQGRAEEAMNLSLRSISLSGNNKRLMIQNWRIVAEACRRLKRPACEEDAYDNIKVLQGD
ncbi:MAG: hypothetical protein D6828_01475 [Nitrospirae bacterium]|nr:MAG: hypothetical protein D6828_01475 [Nitrospirota bacterium]